MSSPMLREQLIERFPEFEHKIHVVGNLIDEENIRQKAGLNETPILRFVSCFRFEPIKTYHLF